MKRLRILLWNSLMARNEISCHLNFIIENKLDIY